MKQTTIYELYQDHYDTLKEEARALFLLKLKMIGSEDSMCAFRILANRWIVEPIEE